MNLPHVLFSRRRHLVCHESRQEQCFSQLTALNRLFAMRVLAPTRSFSLGIWSAEGIDRLRKTQNACFAGYRFTLVLINLKRVQIATQIDAILLWFTDRPATHKSNQTWARVYSLFCELQKIIKFWNKFSFL